MTDSTPAEPTVWLAWVGTWEPALMGVYATLDDAKAAYPAVKKWKRAKGGMWSRAANRWPSEAMKRWWDDDVPVRSGQDVVIEEWPIKTTD